MDGPTPIGLLGRIVELLRRHPVLLYGLGSVLALTVLLTVVTDVDPLVIGAAVLLMLAALGVAAALMLRREPSNRSKFSPKVKSHRIRTGRNAMIGSIKGSTFAGRFSPRITARGSIDAGDGSAIGSIVSASEDVPTSMPRPKPGRRGSA